MKTSLTLLPIVAALAACLWAADAMAQAGTMPAGIGTHGTGQLAGTGGYPGPGDRPDTADRFATAHPAADASLDSAAALRQRALAAMEMLREEIATLTALKHAQAALLTWNRANWEVGEAPATLAAALCAKPALGAWCPLLPATFGISSGEDGNDRD